MSGKEGRKNFPGGVLLFDKPEGMTSHDAVNLARRVFGTRQAGHTGTLDPMASGLLQILVGRAVKASDYLSKHDKKYVAGIRFGVSTDTGDATGNLLKEGGRIPSFEELCAALPGMTGNLMQIPPMYSAVKVGGMKLYDLARRGLSVEREPRPVTVYSLSANKTADPSVFRLDVECSSGTYIRVLCEDLAARLGTVAVMSSLRRTSVGRFVIDEAVTRERLESFAGSAPDKLLIPVEQAFSDYPELRLEPFYEKLIRDGCRPFATKVGLSRAKPGDRYRLLSHSGEFFSLGEIAESENGNVLKSLVLFNL
ncbi:MAG: tRNA pseudouridine(55) synthase TruB [Clostridia bacterium]|nr:tRNA pseudouridine(55) synthase TruB [Clostridia bacterium]